MSFSGTIIYRFARAMLGFTGILSIISALVLMIYVLFPFKPYIRTSSNGVLGFTDYVKGIPFTTKANVTIPDTSFVFEYHLKGSGSSDAHINRYYGEVLDNGRDILNKLKNDTLVYGDTITTSFRHIDFEVDRSIKAAKINSITYYIWPQNRWKRLFLFLPVLLLALTIAYCSWQLSRLMKDIIAEEVFRRKGYKRLAKVGYAILILQLIICLLSFTEFYRHSITIDFQSSINRFRMPFTISSHASSPLSLQWLVAGCIILIIAKGFQRGDRLQKDHDLTI
jgi:hypothetical protein